MAWVQLAAACVAAIAASAAAFYARAGWLRLRQRERMAEKKRLWLRAARESSTGTIEIAPRDDEEWEVASELEKERWATLMPDSCVVSAMRMQGD